MKKHTWPFLCFWILNSLLLYLGGWFYPFYFTLGNKSLSAIWAAVVSGFFWTFITWVGGSAIGPSVKTKSKLVMFGFYLIGNFVALWLTARMAPVFGFGTVSFVWLVFLAIVANFFQYVVWKVCGFKKILN